MIEFDNYDDDIKESIELHLRDHSYCCDDATVTAINLCAAQLNMCAAAVTCREFEDGSCSAAAEANISREC
jgi:hypothetical protein